MELNDSQLIELTSVCNKLSYVSFEHNLCVTDEGIINGLFKNCPNLYFLELYACSAVRGPFLAELPQKLTQLVWSYFNDVCFLHFIFFSMTIFSK